MLKAACFALLMVASTNAVCDTHSRNAPHDFHFGPVPNQDEERDDDKISSHRM